jgi:hypothetical protein
VAVNQLSQQPQDLQQQAAVENISLTISPATLTMKQGEERTFSVMANTRTHRMTAAKLRISYDPARVEIRSAAAGPAFPTLLEPFNSAVAAGKAGITVGLTPPHPRKVPVLQLHISPSEPKPHPAPLQSASTMHWTEAAGIGYNTDVSTATGAVAVTVEPQPTPAPTDPKLNASFKLQRMNVAGKTVTAEVHVRYMKTGATTPTVARYTHTFTSGRMACLLQRHR